MFGMVPFERHEDNFFDVFDNFERKFFGNSSANLPAFRTDIKDADDKFVLEAELPGFDKEDISLDVKDGILTISAQHKEEKEDKDEKGQYIRRERRYGSFRRSFDVTGIDENGITAAYSNGILTLNLPKTPPCRRPAGSPLSNPPALTVRSPERGAPARGRRPIFYPKFFAPRKERTDL